MGSNPAWRMKLQRGSNRGNNGADGPVIVLPRLSRRADETHGITHSTGATEKKPRTKVVAGLIFKQSGRRGFASETVSAFPYHGALACHHVTVEVQPAASYQLCDSVGSRVTTPSRNHARSWASVL